MSGPEALKIASKIFFPSKKNKKVDNMATYTMLYGRVKDCDGKHIDETILSYMKSPATYTREDVVEINCHSGPSIVRKVLELCIENGARLAEPGEFTKRAFLNGRIDIVQAEAVSELIAARSERAGQNALKKLEGQSSADIENIRRSLLEILMKIEAEIEFPDDITPSPLCGRGQGEGKYTAEIKTALTKMILDGERSEKITTGIKIVITGKSNAGKSSLMNRIMKREVSIVTDIPGTTRDEICHSLTINGFSVDFVDTFGIRNPENKIEKIGLEHLEKLLSEADIILFVFDASRKIDEDDYKALDMLKSAKKDCKIMYLANKTDIRIPDFDCSPFAKGPAADSADGVFFISAMAGSGIDRIFPGIENYLQDYDFSETGFSANKRITGGLKKTLDKIEKFDKISSSDSELAAHRIKAAILELDRILGKEFYPEMLDMIFSGFCVGK